jgi:hypothetical protein
MNIATSQIEFFREPWAFIFHTPVLEIWRPHCRCWKLDQMEDDDVGTQWGAITVYRHIDWLLSSTEFYLGENSLRVYLKM